MASQTVTYMFAIADANAGKRTRLHDELRLRQLATDSVLDQLKLRCVMEQTDAYAAGKEIYASIRQQFPTLGSKAAQKIIVDVKSSTLSTSRDKLLATSRVDATLAFDNQSFDFRLLPSTGKFRDAWVRLKLGDSRPLQVPLTGFRQLQRIMYEITQYLNNQNLECRK